ncbi:hypothetical protein DPMN_054198 [Dreissena polymorpha]|uniref:Uncharacterized protein n=1 Tax=Dreissena polymorpha TaxID=45954 RepID=A0A9D4HRE8_DREPO|nr:hypothetical protein DPMN_054198 [Dreissena polymorpha]
MSNCRNLRKALLNIVKMQPKSDKDPSWMFCLPLLHFVFGVCQPYDELGEDMSHASQAPKWWGIVDIKPEIDQFKNNTNKWNM